MNDINAGLNKAKQLLALMCFFKLGLNWVIVFKNYRKAMLEMNTWIERINKVDLQAIGSI